MNVGSLSRKWADRALELLNGVRDDIRQAERLATRGRPSDWMTLGIIMANASDFIAMVHAYGEVLKDTKFDPAFVSHLQEESARLTEEVNLWTVAVGLGEPPKGN